MNLLKKVDFEGIQLSEIEDIVRALGMQMPENDLLERMEEYKEFFEMFFEDEVDV